MLTRYSLGQRGVLEHVGVRPTTLKKPDGTPLEGVGLFKEGSSTTPSGAPIGFVTGQYRFCADVSRRQRLINMGFAWETSCGRVRLPSGARMEDFPLAAANEPAPGMSANAIMVLWSSRKEIGVPGRDEPVDSVRDLMP